MERQAKLEAPVLVLDVEPSFLLTVVGEYFTSTTPRRSIDRQDRQDRETDAAKGSGARRYLEPGPASRQGHDHHRVKGGLS